MIEVKISNDQIKAAKKIGQLPTLRNCVRMALIISQQYNETRKVEGEQPVVYVNTDELERDLDDMGLSLA
jgi:hypothetical protein